MNRRYLLDTNVLSELMRPRPNEAVLDWFARHADASMYASSITQAEILTGIALLPAGKRRTALAQAAEEMFEQDFGDRCLPFDSSAARHYAVVLAERTREGGPITTEDAQIAAIALASGLIVATRNTKDYENIEGLLLDDPWKAEP
jgi:hypothetical protein